MALSILYRYALRSSSRQSISTLAPSKRKIASKSRRESTGEILYRLTRVLKKICQAELRRQMLRTRKWIVLPKCKLTDGRNHVESRMSRFNAVELCFTRIKSKETQCSASVRLSHISPYFKSYHFPGRTLNAI